MHCTRAFALFELVEPPRKIVIRHISQPLYRLTIDLIPAAARTIVSWSQEFDDDKVARRIEKIVVPANEQNLDKLMSELGLEPPREARFDDGTHSWSDNVDEQQVDTVRQACPAVASRIIWRGLRLRQYSFARQSEL